jgi:hypothetical protein
MHFFDIEDDVAGTQRQLWAVFGAVSGVTYLTSVVLLSGVHQRGKLWRVLSRWVRSATDVVASPNAKHDQKLGGDTSSGDTSHAGILPRVFRNRKLEDKKDEEAQDKVVNTKERKLTRVLINMLPTSLRCYGLCPSHKGSGSRGLCWQTVGGSLSAVSKSSE